MLDVSGRRYFCILYLSLLSVKKRFRDCVCWFTYRYKYVTC